MDSRVTEHAKILVGYSCQVKPGDLVIVTAPSTALSLVTEIAAEVSKIGAHLHVTMGDSRIYRASILNANESTLSSYPDPLLSLFRDADVFIGIIAPENTRELADVPSAKLGMFMKGMGPLNELVTKKGRWNATLHPTPSLAQEAGKSFEAYSDFVYGAILRDWPAARQTMNILADRMALTKKVRIVGNETDMSFSLEGRKPLVDSGMKNLPGGEVFTSPVEESVNGSVYFDLPFLFLGSSIAGVRLRYVNGEIVEHSAEVGNELLTEMLSSDSGARHLGELGIGMNRGITEATKNVLFDEKMGDTIHMAVGRAFEELGGKNKSNIHIDMVKSMKEDGAIYFDEMPVYEHGKFFWE
jgi:aminopeptidase